MKRLVSALVIAASTALLAAPRVARAATYDVVAKIPAQDAHFAAVDPGLARVYIQTSGQTLVIDQTTDTVIATLPMSGDEGIVVDPTTHAVFIADFSGVVNVYEGLTLEFVTTIRVGTKASELSIDTSSHTVYCNTDDTLVVIDGLANVVTDTLSFGQPIGGIDVDSTTHRVYVLLRLLEELLILDGTTNTIVDATFAGPNPEFVRVDSALDLIYIVNNADPVASVAILDLTTHALIATTPIGTLPLNVAIDLAAHTFWVVVNGAVLVFDGTTTSLSATILDNEDPYDVAVDPTNHAAYVTHYFTSQVWKIVPACTGVICALNRLVFLGSTVARAHVGHGLGLTLVIAGVAERTGNRVVACQAMDAFISEVADGDGDFLTAEQAATWTEDAVVVEDAMGC
jgi:DNA-binding beta-propeller fold protein YncE